MPDDANKVRQLASLTLTLVPPFKATLMMSLPALSSLVRNGHEISPHFVSGMERSGFPETTQNREIIS